MTHAGHHARRTRSRVGVVLAAVVALVVPTVAIAAPPDGKGPAPTEPSATATQIVFTRIETTGDKPPVDAPGAVGLFYVVQDIPFDVDLEFRDDTGTPAPLSDNRATTVTVRYGKSALGSVDVPANEPSARLTLTIADPASGIRLTADTRPKGATGQSPPFDVLIDSETVNEDQRTSTGGALDGDDVPCIASPDAPVCADLLPPASKFNPGGLLSRGACAGTNCAEFVQVLTTFTPSRSDPATMVMKCDKLLCGGGAIQRTKLSFQLTPTSPDVEVSPCPAKGVVGTDQQFCVDHVQSTRDNAGDTILYLLFIVDAKVRFL